MPDPTPTPGSTPAPAGTPGATPPDGGTPPASATPNPDGNNGGGKVEIDAKELDRLRRSAGRWDAYTANNRGARQNRRSAPDTQPGQPTGDPELLDALKAKEEDAAKLASENLQLKVTNKLRDVFEREEYKDIPAAIKRAILKNPKGFIDHRSETIEDAIADIEDLLDEELDALSKSSAPANGGNPPATPPATPPANGSGPTATAPDGQIDVSKLSGQAKSVAVLKNLLGGMRKGA